MLFADAILSKAWQVKMTGSRLWSRGRVRDPQTPAAGPGDVLAIVAVNDGDAHVLW